MTRLHLILQIVGGLYQHGSKVRMASIEVSQNSHWHQYPNGAAILFGLMPNLQHLTIACVGSFCDPSVALSCLAALPHLRYLRMAFVECPNYHNDYHDLEWNVASLPPLHQLEHFSLDMEFEYGGPVLLPQIPNALMSLTCLDIGIQRGNPMNTANIGQAVGQMHLLQEIWLRGMILYIPSQLSNLPHLRSLYIAGVDSSKVESNEPFLQEGALLNCPSLTTVCLEQVAGFTALEWDMICPCLQHLKKLERLSIQESDVLHEVSAVPADTWCLPSSLTFLQITNSWLDELPHAIASLPNLKLLDLSYNHLHCLPDGPYLESLRALNLYKSGIGKIPASITKAAHLEHLALMATSAAVDYAIGNSASMLPPGCQIIGGQDDIWLIEKAAGWSGSCPRPQAHGGACIAQHPVMK